MAHERIQGDFSKEALAEANRIIEKMESELPTRVAADGTPISGDHAQRDLIRLLRILRDQIERIDMKLSE